MAYRYVSFPKAQSFFTCSSCSSDQIRHPNGHQVKLWERNSGHGECQMVRRHVGMWLCILLDGKHGHWDLKIIDLSNAQCGANNFFLLFSSPRKPADEYLTETEGPYLLPHSLRTLIRIKYTLLGCDLPDYMQTWEVACRFLHSWRKKERKHKQYICNQEGCSFFWRWFSAALKH